MKARKKSITDTCGPVVGRAWHRRRSRSGSPGYASTTLPVRHGYLGFRAANGAGIKVRHALPFMRDVPHQERGVIFDSALRKPRFVGEIAGIDRLQLKRLDLPDLGAEAHAVQPIAGARGRVAHGARLEE